VITSESCELAAFTPPFESAGWVSVIVILSLLFCPSLERVHVMRYRSTSRYYDIASSCQVHRNGDRLGHDRQSTGRR
jgi:hypothetical protein